jgi:aspartate/methionine/tyrosine aminotransferase
MCPGPSQAAAVAALGDDTHVASQRARYQRRLARLAQLLTDHLGLDVAQPGGGFYLWVRSPDGDGWSLTDRLAVEAGIVASPGEFYGTAGSAHVRLALVCPDEALDLVAERVGAR